MYLRSICFAIVLLILAVSAMVLFDRSGRVSSTNQMPSGPNTVRLVESKSGSEKILETVEKFWEFSSSAKFDSAIKLSVATPLGFSNRDPRCTDELDNGKLDQADSKNSVETVYAGKNEWAKDSVTAMSKRIADEKLKAKSFATEAFYKDESIVSVVFSDPEQFPGEIFYEYFFLTKDEQGEWGIFLITIDPIFHNPFFAGQNCSELEAARKRSAIRRYPLRRIG